MSTSRAFGRFAKRYLAAAGGATYAFTLGLRSSRHRHLIHEIADHFGHTDGPPPKLRRVSFAEVTRRDTPVVLPEPIGTAGNVSLLELLLLAQLVRECQSRRIFEIGTFDGRTTLTLAMNAAPDAIVYTLDLPPDAGTKFSIEGSERAFVDKPISGSRYRGTPAEARIRQLYGDSAAFDFSPFDADFVFVDASHAFEYVLNDSEVALQLIARSRRGGVIAWHDYGNWEGVTRALDRLALDPRFAGLRWIEGTTVAMMQVVAPPETP